MIVPKNNIAFWKKPFGHGPHAVYFEPLPWPGSLEYKRFEYTLLILDTMSEPHTLRATVHHSFDQIESAGLLNAWIAGWGGKCKWGLLLGGCLIAPWGSLSM